MKNEDISQVLEYAKEIISLEARAVETVAEYLNEGFAKAVELVLNMPPEGRVVCFGMGKAGLIATKISATLASTATPSFFLHPAEAIHGDLGRVTKFDVALAFSKSGETEEILKVLPYIKRFGAKIISVTGNPESALAEHSDVSLNIGNIDEVGPLGLAPTTSTTAMLALGDALAMTVLSKRDFTPEQFALNHPGGSLGRSLMKAGELMRSGEEHCVVEESEITKSVIHKITTTPRRPGAASVVNSDGILLGVFTDGNLRRCIDEGSEFLDKPISTVMTKDPKNIEETHLVSEAHKIMTEFKIDQLIVVDTENRPKGIIDIQDIAGML